GAGVVYTVKRGDMLTKIAKAYYSDAGRWRVIYVANRRMIGSNPDRLAVGMRLHIPPRTAPVRR
ncbi:MAG: LysM peptidoglycan-binding domain-containing protein, partial [Phycisphaerales bacterium]